MSLLDSELSELKIDGLTYCRKRQQLHTTIEVLASELQKMGVIVDKESST